ncbi:MAG: phosphatidylglycerophosphatase A [Elusimicrobiota bacterium]|jgi:phosphatidylglycerophosphatase A|nr:phosphatidylglycerophosphatase A [Elusimicrobiota bacterium]
MKKTALIFSSVFGIGYIKYASGTFGSLAGLVFWIFIPNSVSAQIIAVLIIIAASIIFANIAEKIYGRIDDGRIVIDEVAGMWVSLLFLPKTIFFLVPAFFLFRFFDISKPLFVDKLQRLKGGFGITADDVAAGVLANIILQIINVLICLFA